MGIPLMAGREFDAGSGTADVVINQPLARQQWPDGRGLGETLRIGERSSWKHVLWAARRPSLISSCG